MSMSNSKDSSLSYVESLSQPFVQSRLRVHRRQSNRGTPFNLLILIDLAFIGLLFGILLTRMVTLPGMNIDFVKTDLKTHAAHTNVAILTLENKDTLFFDGGIYNLKTIDAALNNYFKKDTTRDNTSVIIRSDSKVDLESFLRLCSIIENAGFRNIQILGQSSKNENIGRKYEF